MNYAVIDLASLAWLMPELDATIKVARAHLAKALNSHNADLIKYLTSAKKAIHDATGALQLIDARGVVRYLEALEKSLEHSIRCQHFDQHAHLVIDEACFAVIAYLSEVQITGVLLQPIVLYSDYEALALLSSPPNASYSCHPTDLYFPDLTPRLQKTSESNNTALVSKRLNLNKTRHVYETLLLQIFKGSASDKNLNQLAILLELIANESEQLSAYSFWKTCQAAVQTLTVQKPEFELSLKRWLGRLNLQIQRLASGSKSLSEQLFREALFYTANTDFNEIEAKSSSALIQTVASLYQLSGSVPHDLKLRRYGRATPVDSTPVLEKITSFKLAWDEAAPAAIEAEGMLLTKEMLMRRLKVAYQLASELHALLSTHRLTALTDVTQTLAKAVFSILESGQPLHKSLGVEGAKAILWIEETIKQPGSTFANQRHQADAIIARLNESKSSSMTLPAQLPPSEQSTQELMKDVIRELTTTLSTVEKQLDDYFRFGQESSALQTTIPPLVQSSSALQLVGLPQASLAIHALEKRINGFITHPESVSPTLFSKLAMQFSQITNLLDLFTRAPKRAQEDFLFNSLEEELQDVTSTTKNLESHGFDSVESLTDQRRANAHALLKEVVTTPENTDARVALVESIQILKDDATLTSNPALSELNNLDLSAITRIHFEPPSEPASPPLTFDLQAAQDTKTFEQLGALLSTSSVAVETQTASLAQSENDLYDIFIDEAHAILSDSEQTLHLLEAQPNHLPLLSDLRRNFHTLKGSSRMVGFRAFGDAAWHVEQVINIALARQSPASISLIQFMRCGQSGLSIWLSQLDNLLLNTDFDGSANAEQKQAFLVESTLEGFISQLAPYSLAIERSLNRQDSMPPTFDLPPPVTETIIDSSDSIIETLPHDRHAAPSDLTPQTEAIRPKISLVTNNEGLRPQDFIDKARTAVMQAQANEHKEPVRQPSIPLVLEPVQIAPLVAATPPVSDSMTSIGPLRLPKPLYAIYIKETDQHIQALSTDFKQWEHQTARPSSYDAYKRAHSLKGSAATIGFVTMKELAAPLESVLQISVESKHPLLPTDLSVISNALIAIQTTFNQFAKGEYPSTRTAEIEALSALYIDLSQRRHSISLPELITAPRETFEDVDAQMRRDAFTAARVADDLALQALEFKIASTTHVQTPYVNTEDLLDIFEEPAFVSPDFETHTLEKTDEIDETIWIDFVQEADLIFPEIHRNLVALPQNNSTITALQRDLHTLKGSSRMAGAMRIGALLHGMESELEKHLITQAPYINSVAHEELLDQYDSIQALYESLKISPSQSIDTAPFINLMEKTNALFDDALSNAKEPTAIDVPKSAMTSLQVSTLPVTPPSKQNKPFPVDKQTALALPALRMRTDVLDHLVNQTSEISSSKGRLDQHVVQLRTSLRELTDNVERLRKQLREIEIQAESQLAARTDLSSTSHAFFDPLEFDRFTRFQELTRMLTESLNDMISVRDAVSKTLSETETELILQNKASKDLSQSLMRSRLVPFDDISDRLYRVARQTAKELGKQVTLDIQGGHITLDRSILERFTGSLEHLIRNSVVHGIELPHVRSASNKSTQGKITISLKQQGNELELFLSDDGAGLPLEQIRDVALAKGLLSPHLLPTVQQLAELIFTPGLSTAHSITELAGRGIGMDVVRNELVGMGGRINLTTTPKHNTQFTIRIPSTLAINQVLMVIAQDVQYAIPTALIQTVVSVKPSDLALAYNQKQITKDALTYPFAHFSELLNLPLRPVIDNRAASIILLDNGTSTVAVHVDHILGHHEVLVKPLAPVMLRIPGLSSATLLNDGQLCLIIDPVQLSTHQNATPVFQTQTNPLDTSQRFAADNRNSLYTLDTQKISSSTAPVAMVDVVSTNQTSHFTSTTLTTGIFKLAMVIDDSLTVRKVTEKLLRREGWKVLLAKDGIDALEQLQTAKPSVLLVDIEMPRMDGYDLTRNVRADERLKLIPIIMITSRIADKHRDHAFSLGVNAYMGKPYRDDELLAEIIKLTAVNA